MKVIYLEATECSNENVIPFENMLHDYVKETGNRVYYRVTPVQLEEGGAKFGVILEASSIEDNGVGICFNVLLLNDIVNITSK